jgi:hypothetical protein
LKKDDYDKGKTLPIPCARDALLPIVIADSARLAGEPVGKATTDNQCQVKLPDMSPQASVLAARYGVAARGPERTMVPSSQLRVVAERSSRMHSPGRPSNARRRHPRCANGALRDELL